MKLPRLALSLLALAFVSAPVAPVAAASIYDDQTITWIAVGGPYGGDVVIRLSGHSTNTRPACATDSSWSMRFDGTTDAGKQVYSMALLAQSSGAKLTVSGEDTCISNAQELRWLRLK